MTKSAVSEAVATDAETPVVSCDDLVKSFGRVEAVRGVRFAVRPGETVAVLGPNGAGKSTTVHMMLGLFPPDAGSIELFGMPPEKAVRAGRVGAMLQEGQLVPRVTVGELVGFVAGTYGSQAPAVSHTLELARIADLAGRRVDKLSGGQMQRVRFALALAGGARLVVLDEPTAALDVESRRELWKAMRDYAGKGNTVVFTTHYLEEADDNADRIIVIAQGKVIADGPAEEIKKAAGGRTVAFRHEDQDLDGLAGLPGVNEVRVLHGRVVLTTTDSDATVAALAGAGVPMRDLEVAGADLEDAFVALTSASAEGGAGR
ncbi:ABC transporter ATP-binding protein [Actinomadura sp. NPDC048394]|uniref:ABC transporter ATP-binding protein n=1 Tax=Actinomadura sp. NPDC048394 TaxID=3158223 RepID=UPI0033FE41CA